MSNFTFENQGAATYLVYTLGEEEALDTLSLGMLTRNRIQGLAPVLFTQMNETRYIKYNISSKISARQLFTGVVNKKRLLGVFNGIADALLAAEEYMLDPNSILMDLDYIFADVTNCEAVLICLPAEGQKQETVDLKMFFKNILFSTQFDQTEDCSYVARIMNYLNGAAALSLEDFKTVLKDGNAAPQPQPNAGSWGQPQPQPNVRQQGRMQSQPNAGSWGQLQTPPGSGIGGKAAQGAAPPATPVLPAQAGSAGSEEKQISMFYLLQHYNKENAALYKEQKAAKKAAKDSDKTLKKNRKEKIPQPIKGAVPGEIAIPGSQPTPLSAPQVQPVQGVIPGGIAVPGRQPMTPPLAPQPVMAQGEHADFGDTVMYDGMAESEDTIVRGFDEMYSRPVPYLIRKKNGEKILLNKGVFRLGRDMSFNDYVIADNKLVGRSHCHILVRDDKVFIVDDNSKNHTFLNREAIVPGNEYELSPGQSFRLANEEFEYQIS